MDRQEKQIEPGAPHRQGLYDPANEHDACGLGFIAHIKGGKSHAIIGQGLQILKNLTHRGATGADPLQGDGAGILIQLPDAFFRRACGRQGMTLPAIGQYGVGMVFLPRDPERRLLCEELCVRICAEEGHRALGWRDVPVDPSATGELAAVTAPVVRQLLVERRAGGRAQFERKLYVIRRRVELVAANPAYAPIQVEQTQELRLLGVVRGVVRTVER